MTLYKVTGPSGEPIHGGSGSWPLPKTDRLGRVHRAPWRRQGGELIPCAIGLHLTDEAGLPRWLPESGAFRVWVAEGRGHPVESDLKVVYGEARLVRLAAEVTADQAASWSAFRRAAGPLPRGLAAFPAFADYLADQERKRVARVEAERRLAATDATVAAKYGQRIVFGQHALPPSQRECEAWPSASALAKMLERRADARARKLLGVTERMERLVRTSGLAPEMVTLVYGRTS